MKKVCVFFAEGTEECEALLPVDLLRRAGAEVTLAGIGDELFVTSSHGVQVKMDALAKDLDFSAFDAIVLPGGMPGTTRLGESVLVAKAAHCAMENGKLLAAICAAPTVLAKLGLLSGKRATAHHGFIDKLGDAVVVKEPVVEDGNLVTGWGLGASLPFSLRLVQRLYSADEAACIAAALGYPFEY